MESCVTADGLRRNNNDTFLFVVVKYRWHVRSVHGNIQPSASFWIGFAAIHFNQTASHWISAENRTVSDKYFVTIQRRDGDLDYLRGQEWLMKLQ